MARRSKRFGDMKHRKWFKGKSGGAAGWKSIAAKIQVARVGDTGEGGRPKPYRAIACVGGGPKRGGFYPRHAGTRCGNGRGRTPTLAIRNAFKDLGKNFK
jgi:hypothetical protein